MKKCPKCNGTGFVKDDARVGAELRDKRESMGLSLRSMARSMGLSAAYVSDLERGRRAWTEDIERRYLEVLTHG